jgi:ATP/maltotriose-dependent transcriptional regulator MalT
VVGGGSGPDPLEAARAACARLDWRRALDAARAAGVGSPELAAERADLMADAAWWLGRLDECIEARDEAYRAYDGLGDRRRAGMCAVWLWEHHAMAARPVIAGAWLRRAKRSLEHEPDCVELGALVLREAENAHGGGDLDAALALADRAIAIGRTLGSTDLEAEALQTAGRILIDRGEVAEGMGHLDEAMLFAVEGRLGPYATGKVYCSLIGACEDVGDLDRAAEWTDATTRWAHEHPFAIFPGICRVHRALVLKRRGSLAEAEREAERACEELAGSHPGNSAAAHAEVGDIRRRLGELDRAEEAFVRAQELSGRPCGAFALLRLAQGRTAQAMAIASGCLRRTPNRLARGVLLPIVVQVAIAARELELARSSMDELDDIAAAFDTPVLRASARSARGRCQLAAGDAERAVSTLCEAVEQWEAIDVPYEVATVRTLLGEAQRSSGDEAAALESFMAAADLFERVGARLDARRLADADRPALPAGLSEREAEVLRLVASGLTNGEIATALCLSVKTVSRHLSNIFTKIDVSSRTAATAFAFEQGLLDPPRSARRGAHR